MIIFCCCYCCCWRMFEWEQRLQLQSVDYVTHWTIGRTNNSVKYSKTLNLRSSLLFFSLSYFVSTNSFCWTFAQMKTVRWPFIVLFSLFFAPKRYVNLSVTNLCLNKYQILNIRMSYFSRLLFLFLSIFFTKKNKIKQNLYEEKMNFVFAVIWTIQINGLMLEPGRKPAANQTT